MWLKTQHLFNSETYLHSMREILHVCEKWERSDTTSYPECVITLYRYMKHDDY